MYLNDIRGDYVFFTSCRSRIAVRISWDSVRFQASIFDTHPPFGAANESLKSGVPGDSAAWSPACGWGERGKDRSSGVIAAAPSSLASSQSIVKNVLFIKLYYQNCTVYKLYYPNVLFIKLYYPNVLIIEPLHIATY